MNLNPLPTTQTTYAIESGPGAFTIKRNNQEIVAEKWVKTGLTSNSHKNNNNHYPDRKSVV